MPGNSAHQDWINLLRNEYLPWLETVTSVDTLDTRLRIMLLWKALELQPDFRFLSVWWVSDLRRLIDTVAIIVFLDEVKTAQERGVMNGH